MNIDTFQVQRQVLSLLLFFISLMLPSTTNIMRLLIVIYISLSTYLYLSFLLFLTLSIFLTLFPSLSLSPPFLHLPHVTFNDEYHEVTDCYLYISLSLPIYIYIYLSSLSSFSHIYICIFIKISFNVQSPNFPSVCRQIHLSLSATINQS